MRIRVYLLTCAVGLGLASAAALAVPPANNNCLSIPASAQFTGAGTNEGNVTAAVDLNSEATKDGATSSCGRVFNEFTNPTIGNSNDVWYLYTAGLTGFAEVFATNCSSGATSSRDLGITVFLGSGCGNPTEHACFYGLCHGGAKTFPVTAGQVYLLRVANYGNSVSGTPTPVTATLNITELAPTPPNDTCASAEVLPVNGSATFRNFLANASTPFATCGVGNDPTQQDVWVTYTAAQTGNARFLVGGPLAHNITITAFDNCSGSTILDCRAPNTPNARTVCIGVTGGQSYKIRLGRPASTDSRKHTISVTEYQPGIEGETCHTPLVIPPGNGMYNVNGLGYCDHDEDLGPTCLPNNTSVGNIWLRYTPSISGVAVFSTVPPNPDNNNGINTYITALSDCDTVIDCNDDRYHNFNNGSSYVSFPVTQGVPVLVRIGSFVYGAQYVLSVAVVPPFSNDDCPGATEVVLPPANNISIDFDNLNATNSVYSPFPCVGPNGDGKNDLWWKWTAPSDGSVGAGTCWNGAPIPSAAETIIAVYDNSCSGAVAACDDEGPIDKVLDEPGLCGEGQAFAIFNAVAGHTYYFRVGGQLSSYFGIGKFYLRFTPLPCTADFNHVNGVTVQDIFDFLTAWLAGSPIADFNHVNGVTVQDIFDFLTAWLAGC